MGEERMGPQQRHRLTGGNSEHAPRGRQCVRRCTHQFTGVEQGFMLIELLIVLAIVALLMAILLPTLQRVRAQARAVVCRTYLRQWGTILSLYLEDNAGCFPRSDGLCPGLPILRGIYIDYNIDPNAPGRTHGVRTEKVACCPMATKTTADKAGGVQLEKWPAWMRTFRDH